MIIVLTVRVTSGEVFSRTGVRARVIMLKLCSRPNMSAAGRVFTLAVITGMVKLIGPDAR